MKKIFITSLILLLLSLISWGAYSVISKNKLPQNQTKSNEDDLNKGNENDDTNTSNTTFKNSLFNISEISVLTADMDIYQDLIRYVTKDGKAMTMTPRGTNQKELFKVDIENLENAIWSPNKNDLILHANNKYYTYSSEKNKKFDLKPSIDNVVWSSINNKILYKYFDNKTKKRSITISKQNGENWRNIIDIPFRHVSFKQIPNSSNIAFWQSGDSFLQSKLQTINAISPNKPLLIHEGLYGADYLYSPDGKTILVSSTIKKGGSKMTMGIMNKNGGEYTNLKIPTVVQKAVWSKDNRTVYYAQPSDIPENSVMPNDYKNGKFQTRDTFWKLDTKTNKKSRLIDLKDLTEKIDASNLFISESEDSLFFINKTNDLLYRLKLLK